MAYSFEKQKRSTRRVPCSDHPDVTELKKDLNIEGAAFDPQLTALVMDFSLNIVWYQGRIAKERIRQWFFFLVSALILLAIPGVVYWITSGNSDNSQIGVQITIALTGLIAFHNLVRHWLETRNGIALFHEASSKLQTVFYEFVEDWRGRTDDDQFQNAVAAQLQIARNIVNDEQDKYFLKTATLPTVDLGATLTGAGQAAGAIVQQHRGKLSEQEAGVRESNRDVREKVALVKKYESWLEEQEAELSSETDPAKKSAIEQSITGLRAAVRTAKEDRLKAEARLARFS